MIVHNKCTIICCITYYLFKLLFFVSYVLFAPKLPICFVVTTNMEELIKKLI